MVSRLSTIIGINHSPLLFVEDSDKSYVSARLPAIWVSEARFDDPGMAMLFHRNTRAGLYFHDHGVVVEGFHKIESPNNIWKSLIADIRSEDMRIKLCRALIYLGLYSDARRVSLSIENPEWRYFIQSQLRRVDVLQNFNPLEIYNKVKANTNTNSIPLIESFLLILPFLTEKNEWQYISNEFESLFLEYLDGLVGWQREIYEARYERILVQFSHNLSKQYKYIISNTSNLDKSGSLKPMLMRENMIRICQQYLIDSKGLSEQKSYLGVEVAQILTEIDPFDPKSMMIAHNVLASDQGISKVRRKSYQDFGLFGHKYGKTGYSTEAGLERIRASTTYSRTIPFYDPKIIKTDTGKNPSFPLLMNQGIVRDIAREVEANPYYDTIRLQRAVDSYFRWEMVAASIRDYQFNKKLSEQLSKLQSYRGFNDYFDSMLEEMGVIDRRSVLERVSMARHIGGLGFYAEAIDYLDDTAARNSLEKAYKEVNLNFLIDQKTTRRDQDLEHERIYNLIPNAEDALKMRLNLCLSALVRTTKKLGRQGDLAIVSKWVKRAELSLEAVLNCSKFDDFEKNLLASRTYRATCYLPYMSGDLANLERQIEFCTAFAFKATPTNKLQQLLYKENLYPMHETAAKVLSRLGDKEGEIGRLNLILSEVDNLDPRVWLQIGEIEERRGQFEEALDKYYRAWCLNNSYQKIASFRIGALLERMGHTHKSREFYYESLMVWPFGITPAKKLAQATATATSEDLYRVWAHNVNFNSVR